MREPLEPLTAREENVFDLLRRGLTNGQIAAELEISEHTAKEHVSNILRKLGVASRYEASYWPERAPWWVRLPIVAPIATLLHGSTNHFSTAVKIAAGAVALGVTAGFIMFAVLLVRSDGDLAPDRSGTPEIDSVLDAVESGDPERIGPLVELTERPCETLDRSEIVPSELAVVECEDDEPEGTLVDAYWLSTCNGSWWYRAADEEEAVVAARIMDWDLSLFAVYRGREGLPDTFVDHDQVAIFTTDQNGAERGIGLFLKEGRIVGTDEDCGLPPEAMAGPSRLTEPILIVDKESSARTPTP